MAREDIIGGLKVALSKGETLEEAMQSFYNSGYKKEEIEEAARVLQSGGFQQQLANTIEAKPIVKALQLQPPIQQPIIQQNSPVQQPILPPQPTFSAQQQIIAPKQNVSAYESKKRPDVVTVLLILILLILLGILVSVFLFKDQLVEFLNKILE